MARLLPEDFIPEKLNIEIKEVFPNCTEVFYIPSSVELKEAGLNGENPTQYKRKIALFNGQDRFITVYPIFTLPTHPHYLKQKYNQIIEINVELEFGSAPYSNEEVVECLQQLPVGFIKGYSLWFWFDKRVSSDHFSC